MRKAALTVSLISIVALSLAACSSSASPTPAGQTAAPDVTATPGGTSPPGGGNAPDASALVTADIAASVIGGTPTKIDIPSLGGSGTSIASYITTAGDSFTVYVQAVPGSFTATELQAAMALQGANGDMTPISGLGDAAGKVVSDHDATVAFVKGNVIVVLGASASAQAGTDLETKLENLGHQIAGQL